MRNLQRKCLSELTRLMRREHQSFQFRGHFLIPTPHHHHSPSVDRGLEIAEPAQIPEICLGVIDCHSWALCMRSHCLRKQFAASVEMSAHMLALGHP
jgi:hypothetical protein